MVRFQKLIKIYFLPYPGTTYTVRSGNCPSFSCVTSCSLLMLTAGPRDQFPRWRRSRTFCVLRFEVSRSVITVQREFLALFKKDAPHKNNVFFKPCTKITLHCNHRSGHLRLTEHYAMKTYEGVLDLGTSWRWVVSFTPRPLYLRGKNPPYPFDRRLGGPQSRSGRYGEVKILGLTGTRTPTPPSSSP
jgi:hypothetical protein